MLLVVGALVAAILIISLSSKDDSKPTATSPATTYTKTVTPTSAPDATDRLFITTLRNEGIPVRSEDDAVLKARALCLTFDKHPGTSIEEATLGFITKVETTFTPQQGAFFIGAAVAGYCPEHRTW